LRHSHRRFGEFNSIDIDKVETVASLKDIGRLLNLSLTMHRTGQKPEGRQVFASEYW